MSKIKKLENFAKKHGYTIAIGHPTEWTSLSNAPKKDGLYAFSIFSHPTNTWFEPYEYYNGMKELIGKIEDLTGASILY